MKSLTLKHLLIVFLVFFPVNGISETVSVKCNMVTEIYLIQPRKAKKAQKKQDKKEKQKKKDIKNDSKKTRKRAYEIQSPEVQARMKQNKKDAAARDKAKRKKDKAKTRSGARKYK
jgi:flagellar biosynthesis component FlhA